jgi:exonuclease SbcD
MKFIHTSDWHLGQRLLFNDRQEEQALALNWLYELILQEQVDALIVAGDIFDTSTPPHPARRLYYNFLTRLLGTSCRYIVITGGNHDSPGMLEAPKELLKNLNIHVIGAASANPTDDLIALRNPQGELEAVVAAIPFLRDRDLSFSVAGETALGRIERIQEGIQQYFWNMGEAAAKEFPHENVPILVTGHLYAVGAEASGKQDNIYIGNTENLRCDQLHPIFDYLALGHIHRPQTVGGVQHVRYSGSLIPLSFSETKDEKGVYLLHFSEKELSKIDFVPIPVFRRLKTIQGSLAEVEEKIKRFAEKEREGLRPWLEVIIDLDRFVPNLDTHLKTFTQDLELDLLKIKVNRAHTSLDAQTEALELDELETLDVFQKKCQSSGLPPETQPELEQTFRELLDWVNNAATEELNPL